MKAVFLSLLPKEGVQFLRRKIIKNWIGRDVEDGSGKQKYIIEVYYLRGLHRYYSL